MYKTLGALGYFLLIRLVSAGAATVLGSLLSLAMSAWVSLLVTGSEERREASSCGWFAACKTYDSVGPVLPGWSDSVSPSVSVLS